MAEAIGAYLMAFVVMLLVGGALRAAVLAAAQWADVRRGQ